MRDLSDYSEKYSKNNFEEYKVEYRRRKVIEFIEKYNPDHILEIGCGMDPLFMHYEKASYTLVEPSTIFYENARKLVGKRKDIQCICGFFEEVATELKSHYDMVICSSLLHEVEKPEDLLDHIKQICSADTIVHINVPNANSLHRILGQKMGVIADVHEMSENNIAFQQNHVYDLKNFKDIVLRSGFEILDEGSFFVKPFSHKQMYQMLEMGIIDQTVLEGLYLMGEELPEYGSELYLNCRIGEENKSDE